MRTCAYTRTQYPLRLSCILATSPLTNFAHRHSSSSFGWESISNSITYRFRKVELAISRYTKLFSSLFYDFFPLWANISPYSFREARENVQRSSYFIPLPRRMPILLIFHKPLSSFITVPPLHEMAHRTKVSLLHSK